MPASAKPTTKYKWATALTANGPSGGDNRVEYEVRQEEQGWIWTEKPPFETFNQWQYSVGLHIDWSLQNIDAIFAFIDASTGHEQNTDSGTSKLVFEIGNGGSTNPKLEFNDSTNDAETPYVGWDFSSQKIIASDTGDAADQYLNNPNYQQRTTADWCVSEMILALNYGNSTNFNFSDQSALGDTDEATAKAAAISDLDIASGNTTGDLLTVWWYNSVLVGKLSITYRNFSNYRWTGTWVDLVTSSFQTVRV